MPLRVEITLETTIHKKLIEISEICKKNIVSEFLYSHAIFFVINSNFTNETYGLIKLYFEVLLAILVSSQFKLYTL